MNSIIKQITIIGFGGLAQNLLRKLLKQSVYPELSISVVIRNPEYYRTAKDLFHDVIILDNIQELEKIDTDSQFHFIIICVPDDQIINVCEDLNEIFKGTIFSYTESNDLYQDTIPIILHTSGSTPMEIFGNLNFPHLPGVFYPLNTFSKFREPDWLKTPIFLEVDHSNKFFSPIQSELLLKSFAFLFNSDENKIRFLSSKERLALHCGAVFASNFLNFMISQSGKIVGDIGFDHKIYTALINETIQKLSYSTPEESQTGPAKRGDMNTITKHITYLENNQPEILEIYRSITQLILKTYSKSESNRFESHSTLNNGENDDNFQN